ncbi:MAG: hypothetical protein PF630_05825 [Gammaproteobacteria bacterium]|nr:hypothetical protein [Gammaproteobacteria bacterium]
MDCYTLSAAHEHTIATANHAIHFIVHHRRCNKLAAILIDDFGDGIYGEKGGIRFWHDHCFLG